MESSSANKYITPTLQANLNLAINDVIHCFNAGLIFEAWRALETLYGILPPKVYKEVEIKHDNIEKELGNSGVEATSYESLVTNHDNGMQILRKYVRPFFREMYELLYKGGYLEKQQREIETNVPSELLEQ